MSKSDSRQLSLIERPLPKPTGDLWKPSRGMPTTVPVPLPVVVVRVDGPCTALDRKLWVALLRHAHSNLDKPGHIHEVSISELVALFRKVSGRRDLGVKGTLQLTKKLSEETGAATLWESVRRLAKTTIEWEDADYVGINNLLGARMDKSAREQGKLYFTFDPLLAQNLLAPRAWARLNVHVMMKLRSKYAVTLYEILEAYVNRENKSCVASMEEVRAWLKVSEEASSYAEWKDFRRRVIEPAVSEINKHADDAGFTVAYEGIREGKSYTKIRFTVTKTGDRYHQESQIKAAVKAKTRRLNAENGVGDPDRPPLPSGVAIEKFRADWPGKDPYEIIGLWQDKWRASGCETLKSPDGAFLKFAEGCFKARSAKAKHPAS